LYTVSAPALRAGRRRLLSLFGSVLILSGLLPIAAAAPAAAASTTVVISEFRVRGPNGAADEFIELYNLSSSPVAISGLLIRGSNNTAGVSTRATIPAGTTINAGCHYLITNSSTTGGPYSGSVAGDLTYATGITDDGGIALTQADGTTILDAVGMSVGSAYKEGTPLASLGSGNTNQGYERKPGGASGSTQDSDDNSLDFAVVAPSQPQNSGSACVGGDAAPFVQSSVPAQNATGVAINSSLEVTFSEDVSLTTTSVTLSCTLQGPKNKSIVGGPSEYSIATDNFLNGDHCTLTIPAAAVHDSDANDPPDTMAAPFILTFDTAIVTSPIVINEVDYDQVGTDTAEYFELKNASDAAINLDAYSVRLINGNAGGALVYDTVDLPDVDLAAGDWWVVCADAAAVPNCDQDLSGANNDRIQNGSPDAIGLVLGSVVVDALSYEGNSGAPYTEGTGTPIASADSNTVAGIGLSRCLDGTDTNNNSVDFQLRAITPGARNTCPGDDTAPNVANSFPINGATDVGVGANLTITFNEPVNVTDPWFTLTCNSVAKAATYSGNGTTFTIDPAENFVDGDVCSLTVLASQVHDQDGIDPPDNMEVNFTVGFTAQDVCVQTFTPIYTIQGSGSATPIPGPVTTEGVVVGAFDDPTGIGGFYIQDATGDGDPATSDGIFVYTNNNNSVSVGDVVRVSANASERFTQTALTGATATTPIPSGAIVECGTGSVTPTAVTMPFATASSPERYEGMLVTFPQPLVISEYFNYDRFGEIVLALPLAGEDRPFTGTAVDAPGAPANARTAANLLRRITLDDNVSSQNPAVLRHPNGQPFTLTNRFRGGDTVANTTGVLGFDFSLYRIFPTAPADYTAVNPRTAAPENVGGTIRAAAMNTLNFFLTLDTTTSDSGPGPCGGNANLDCRGADADQPDEFPRQRTKLLQALAGLDADVIGLNELENTPGVEPLLDPNRGIVAGLNDLGAGPFAAIDTGVIGTDAIRVGIIYRSDVLQPLGAYKILNSTVDPRFLDTKNRPSLAQTFDVIATGARFTVVVNHLKSKGSDCLDVGDPDTGDGQGNCNGTRTKAAQALADWIATDPTGSGDRDYLVLGDLNSYAMENPVSAIKAGADDTAGTGDDFTNLIAKYQGPYAHSYVFDGQAGYLDYALASPTLLSQVTGAADWHINSDEPDILDYDTSFKPPAQEALYEPNQYRTSDHDPVVVGLNLLSYQFNGFQAPVDNPPAVNGVKLGQSVPVKFQLAGDLGLGVLFGTPTATPHECDAAGGLPDPLETTATAGSSGLQYDPATNTYTYVWKTDKTGSPGCRTFEITFDDGTYRRAQFQFTK